MSLLQTLLTTGGSVALIALFMRYQPGRWIRPHAYSWPDLRATAVIGAGGAAIGTATIGLATGGYDWAYAHRFLTMPLNAATICLVFALDDLCYYAFHRCSHRMRLLWASHAVHHSSHHFNLSIALRQPWTGRLTGQALFWTPLSFIGVSTEWILWQGSVSLLYQFWTHCEGIGRLPRFFEYVLNTPSHHHVHHASNEHYLDCNFGGVLIIWDRVFGTFVAEISSEPCRYGLADGFVSSNPIAIVFHGWGAFARDLIRPTARLRSLCKRL